MRLVALAAAVLLARAPAPEVCGALNVTVSPGPVVDYLEGENATLLCHVSQKRRKDSLLAVRWFFARPDSQEALMVKMTKLRVVQYYGNYSRSAYRRRLRLLEERRGALYTLSVLTLGPADQGHYVCKVQEISKHRNKWTAWSNGSSATEMRVISLKASEDSSFEKKKKTWAVFEDLYVYAVLVCCAGILSVLLFTLAIIWQSVFNKRKSRVRHYLVKCPQNSSGETVTSVTSLAPLQPKKGKRRREKADVPPAVPAKAQDCRGELNLCRAGAHQTPPGCQRHPHQHRLRPDPLRREQAVTLRPLPWSYLIPAAPVIYETLETKSLFLYFHSYLLWRGSPFRWHSRCLQRYEAPLHKPWGPHLWTNLPGQDVSESEP
uniref:V-set and transmembrane domain-containing protein 4 n=1 Tax=Equus caballus TaxID=9796 RepID=A0A9L0R5Q9_HORSE